MKESMKTKLDIYPLPFDVPDTVRYHIGDTYRAMPTSELDRETLQKLVDKLGQQIMEKAGHECKKI